MTRASQSPAVLLVVAGLAACPPAQASGYGTFSTPEHDLALGPAVAFAYGPDVGLGLGFDTAYTYSLFAASVNLKYVHQADYDLYGAQAELSMWYIANFGLGAGYLEGDDAGPVLHFFTGFPFGDNHYFVEPYYRLNFFIPDGLQLIHELGVMVKYTTFHI